MKSVFPVLCLTGGLVTALPLYATDIDTAREAVKYCEQQAEANTAADIPTYINNCLDEMMQYDTSED